MKKIPSVFKYLNYREYLTDYYVAMKELDRRFTYERFSRTGGIKSPNLLKLVMDGQKNLTNSSLLAFAQALDLQGQEKDFFFNLVHFCQSGTELEKKYFQARLKELKPARAVQLGKATNKSGLYDNIFITTAACLLQGTKTGDEESLLEAKLGLTKKLAQRIKDSLVKTGLLYSEDGHWRIDVNHVVFHEKTPSLVLKKFLRDQLLFSLSAFDAGSNEETKLLSHVMTIDSVDAKEIQEKLDSYLAELNRKYEKTSGIPFQINCQSFPVTPSIGKDFLRRTGQA